jgi:membrane associated rhomboid family serine protease
VSLLVAVIIAAVPFLLASNPGEAGRQLENSRTEAREYLVRNSRLEVDTLGELILDPGWLAEMREAPAADEAAMDVRLPPRMLARSQARLDALIEEAYEARMNADPAWRLGVLDARSPKQNLIAHAFVHANTAAVILGIVVLLLIGAPLERTWGSSIYGLFIFASIPLVAQAYRLLDASSGVPWSGAAGLSAALLGAYFIRGLGGYFILPGWVVLPAWLAAESFIVRGFWLDDLGSVPWATLAAAIGVGALVAGTLRLWSIEARVDDLTAKRKARGPNPIVARAARLRSDGDPYQAFDLIQAAWRDDPGDEEVCEAFFTIAVEVDQPEAAAEAILPSLRSALKQGDVARAIEYSLPLASREVELALETTASVRLGEALLDAGHPDEALFSLRSALDAGVSSAHATRIVNIARDLDEGLARQAASIALSDQGLDAKIRRELEPIILVSQAEPPKPIAVEPLDTTSSQLARRVQAEHQTVETTSFPLDSDRDLDIEDEEILDRDFSGDLAEPDPNEAALADQALDAGALCAESFAEDLDAFGDSGSSALETSGDVLSHWTGEESASLGVDGETVAEVSAALAEEAVIEALPAVDDLETPDLVFDFGLNSKGRDWVDPLEDETDSDLTPMMDVTDELTSPMAVGMADSLPSETSTAIYDQPLLLVEDGPSAPEFAETRKRLGRFNSAREEATSTFQLRRLKALEAVPVQSTENWIEIDADERGKSKLPLARIQAISMAAVSGLGPRPVLVVDCVLNWAGDTSEPMKLIRFRNDRFDPMEFVSDAANPLEALVAWVTELESRSGATCLPTRDLLVGKFARFAALGIYEREVLMASAAD